MFYSAVMKYTCAACLWLAECITIKITSTSALFSRRNELEFTDYSHRLTCLLDAPCDMPAQRFQGYDQWPSPRGRKQTYPRGAFSVMDSPEGCSLPLTQGFAIEVPFDILVVYRARGSPSWSTHAVIFKRRHQLGNNRHGSFIQQTMRLYSSRSVNSTATGYNVVVIFVTWEFFVDSKRNKQ